MLKNENENTKTTYYLYQNIGGKFYTIARSKDFKFVDDMRKRKNNPLIVTGI